MKNLLTKRVQNNNEKIKAEANKNKQLAEKSKAKEIRKDKKEVIEEKVVSNEAKTLMLYVY